MARITGQSIALAMFKVGKIGSQQHTFGPVPKTTQDFLDVLQKHLFRSIDEGAVPFAAGWVPIDNYRGLVFVGQLTHVGDYVVFTLRIDRRMVPPAALKKLYEDMVDKELATTGRKGVNKERRQEIKENARLMLLNKVPPTPSMVDVVYNLKAGTCFFTSVSKLPIETGVSLFEPTFQQGLVRFRPSDWVGQELDADTEGSFFRDMLTYLWNKQEQLKGDPFVISSVLGTVSVQFAEKINLFSEQDGVVKVASPSHSWDEVRTGIEDGKTIQAASLWVKLDDDAWRIEVKSSGDITLKCKKLEQKKDDAPEAVMLERIAIVEKAIGCIGAICKAYYARD